MPDDFDLVPVDHDPWADLPDATDVTGVGYVPTSFQNNMPASIASNVGQGIASWAAAPGNVMQGQQPQTSGQWSDVDEAIRQANAQGETNWGAQTALNMVGGSPLGAETGAAGIAGGKLWQPESPVWWHGSASGDLRGGTSGLHLGTKTAATQALEARIGTPADGLGWTGDREYGDTLLAGTDTLDKMGPYNQTGIRAGSRTADYPKEDHYAADYFKDNPKEWPIYADGSKMPLDVKPSVDPYYITGPMNNRPTTAYEDFKANGYMRAALKKGNAKNGYYYTNQGEDTGSISAVVPNGNHITPAGSTLGSGSTDKDLSTAITGLNALNDIRPPRENISTVLDSNFNYGRAVGNDTASLDSLTGGTRTSSPSDAKRVQSLVSQMSGPNGYWERPIVDDAGNVIEGNGDPFASDKQGMAKGGNVKATKLSVHYRKGKGGIRCGTCTMFHPPNVCSAVQGTVSAGGLCDLYEAKEETNPKIVRKFDVPYLAGSSNDSKTVYIDRRVPKRIAIRRANGKGRIAIDPAEFLAAHEEAEHKAMMSGKPYAKAHAEDGTPAERALVEKHGLDWTSYEGTMDELIERTEHEKPKYAPPDLYTKPYPHRKAVLLQKLGKAS